MSKLKPCLSCTRVKDPDNCESKCCPDWKAWFMNRWNMIHGYYLKHKGGAEDGK